MQNRSDPTRRPIIAVMRAPGAEDHAPCTRKLLMPESPVEHFEHAEHAGHAALLGDPFLMQVAVTIAILAVIAATVGSLETLEMAGAVLEGASRQDSTHGSSPSG